MGRFTEDTVFVNDQRQQTTHIHDRLSRRANGGSFVWRQWLLPDKPRNGPTATTTIVMTINLPQWQWIFQNEESFVVFPIKDPKWKYSFASRVVGGACGWCRCASTSGGMMMWAYCRSYVSMWVFWWRQNSCATNFLNKPGKMGQKGGRLKLSNRNMCPFHQSRI